MTPAYFGVPRQALAWREMPIVPTPVGRSCHYCGDPIAADDDGVLDPQRQAWHADCWVLQVMRKANPDLGIPEIGRQTLRQAASEAVLAFERQGRL